MGSPTVYALEPGHWENVKGVRRWVPDPDPVLAIPHGTDTGYYMHRHHKVEQCQPCIDAHTAETAHREGREPTGRKHRHVAACGTPSGYKRHRRNMEPACDECTAANTAANAARRGYFRERRLAIKQSNTSEERSPK